MPKYRATYDRNDGEFHSNWNYHPTRDFKAKNDKAAVKSALAHIERERKPGEDFELNKLEEITTRDVPIPKRG